MEELNDFLDPIERLKLEREFQEVDLKAAQGDEYLTWRVRVNSALALEAVTIIWPEDDGVGEGYVTIYPGRGLQDLPGVAPHMNVPLLHLEDLYQQNANPIAVACYLKAILFDKRFRLWVHEESEDEDEGPLV